MKQNALRNPAKAAPMTTEVCSSIDMLTMNQPPLTQHISIPKDMSQLSCEAFTAGIIEGVLDGLDVVSFLHLPHVSPGMVEGGVRRVNGQTMRRRRRLGSALNTLGHD